MAPVGGATLVPVVPFLGDFSLRNSVLRVVTVIMRSLYLLVPHQSSGLFGNFIARCFPGRLCDQVPVIR